MVVVYLAKEAIKTNSSCSALNALQLEYFFLISGLSGKNQLSPLRLKVKKKYSSCSASSALQLELVVNASSAINSHAKLSYCFIINKNSSCNAASALQLVIGFLINSLAEDSTTNYFLFENSLTQSSTNSFTVFPTFPYPFCYVFLKRNIIIWLVVL